MDCNFNYNGDCQIKYGELVSSIIKCNGPDCILQRILKGQEKECNCDENQKFADKVPLEEWKTITWYCPRHGNQKR